MSWRERAACIGADPDLFFDDTRKHEAKAVCEPCPVTEECLGYAVNEPSTSDYGVWGGTTRAQRHHMRYRSTPTPGKREGHTPSDRQVLAAAKVSAQRFGVTTADLFGPSRPYVVARARRWMWWMLIEAGWSTRRTAIRSGFEFTTVSRSVQAAQRQITRGEVPPEIVDLVRRAS